MIWRLAPVEECVQMDVIGQRQISLNAADPALLRTRRPKRSPVYKICRIGY